MRAQSSSRAQPQGFSAAAWLCWIYIVLAIGRLSELIPVLAKIPLSKIVAAAWALALLARKSGKTQLPSWPLPTVRAGIALLILAWLSIFFSIWPGASWQFLSSGGIIIPVSLLLMLVTLSDWPAVRGTLRSLVICGTVFCVFSILGYSGGRVSVGYSFDPNDLGYLLVTVLPLSIAFTIQSKGLAKLINLGITAAVAGITILTQSRGGFVALLVIVLFLVFSPLQAPEQTADAKPARKKKGSQAGNGFFRRLMIVGACAAIGWAVAPPDAKQRLLTVFELKADYNMDDSNNMGRTSVWKRNLGALMKRPIGFGVFASPMVDMRSGGRFIQMHNSVVQIAVELGVLGAGLFLGLYWMAWRWMGRIGREKRSEHPEGALFARALRLSVIANFIAGFFLSQAYSNLFWVLMTVCTATAIVLNVPYSLPKQKSTLSRRAVPQQATARVTDSRSAET